MISRNVISKDVISKDVISKEEIFQTLAKRHTQEYQEKFQNAKVAIAGLGGLGSNIAILLARAGVGHLHLIDFDVVDLSNIHRQQYFLGDIGNYKTDVMQQRLLEINPYIHIKTTTAFVTTDNCKELFADADLICEAFDKPEQKSMLVDGCFSNFTDKILVGGSGMAGFDSGNNIQTRKITNQFYLCGDMTCGLETADTLVAARVAICAAHQANTILQLIAGKDVLYENRSVDHWWT